MEVKKKKKTLEQYSYQINKTFKTYKKQECYIIIKGSIQEGDTTIINISAPSIGAPQYIRQMLAALKGENGSNTVIVGDFNTPLPQ